MPTAIVLVAVALVTFYAYQRVTEELVIERDQELVRLAAGQLADDLTEYTDLLTALTRTADIYRNDPSAQRAALKRASNRLVVGGYRSVWTNKILHLLSARTGEDVALTPPGTSASSPAWSPDAQRLAYVAMPDRGDPAYGLDAEPSQMPRRLFVVSTWDTLHPQQLTDDPSYRDEYPLWSADGNYLLFVRADAEAQASLWLVQSEGDTLRRVVDGLTQGPGQSTYFGHWQATVIPYYGHMNWSVLFDWWRGSATPKIVRPGTPEPSKGQ